MTSTFLKRVGGIFIITLFLAFNFSLYGQEDVKQPKDQKQIGQDDSKFKQTATELTNSLSQKVALTPDQTKEITDALVDYQKDLSNLDPMVKENEGKFTEIDNSIKSEIGGILDDKQITAYNDVKEQWWKEVKTKTQSATVRQNQDKDKPY
jgi:hypothetical protein